MKFNVEIPDEVHKVAKIKAIERGVTLKDYISEAINKENSL